MESENKQEKIVLPEELQKSILKFFLKTSIPRILRKEKLMNETLSEEKGQEKK